MNKKLITAVITMMLCMTSALSTLSAQEVPSVKTIQIPETLPGSTLTTEETRNVVCFPYLLSEYKKATLGWGASTEILERIPSENFLIVRKDRLENIWPKKDQAGRWRELLRLVNFAETTEAKDSPGTRKAYVIFSQSGVIVEPWRQNKESEIVMILLWGKEFCQQELIGNRKINSFQAGESFLDSWMNPEDKNYNNLRSVIEKKWRIAGLSAAITRLNVLADTDNLRSVYHCKEEKIANEETAVCAELLWQYEFKPIKALIDTSTRLLGQDSFGKPNYLPKDIEGFFRESSGDKAVVKYLRYKMKYWYDRGKSPDYNPPLDEQIETLRTEIETAMSENQTAKVAELQAKLDTLSQAQTQFDRYAVYWAKHK